MPATRDGILSIIGRTKGNVAPLRCHRKNPGRSAEGEVKKRATMTIERPRKKPFSRWKAPRKS